MAVQNNVAVYNQVFQGTPYAFAGGKNLNGRVVEKYLFNNQVDQANVQAAQAIRTLLANHQNLCPTFSTNQGELEVEVVRSIYLTINGTAVCLAQEPEAPGDAARDFKDRFFSEALMQEPTQCPQGHWLELSRARIWAANAHNMCPTGNHLIGNLVLDQALQHEIHDFRRAKAQQHREHQNLVMRQQLLIVDNARLQLQQQDQQQQINNMQSFTTTCWSLGRGGGKLIIKLGITKGGIKAFGKVGGVIAQTLIKKGTEETAKQAAKEGGKAWGKSVAKKLPGVSLLIGIGLGFYRFYEGQWVKGVGEIASGAVACAPGYGTAISMGLDVIIAGHDVYEACTISDEAHIDLNMAYQTIGINLAENNNPTREQVDHAYRAQALLIHPDRIGHLGAYNQEQLGELTQVLNACRDFIYQERGWA
jgi:hypothetical protein